MIPLVSERLGELRALCAKHRVISLALFGSAARDDFNSQTSDLDFLVEFADLPPGELSRNHLAFAEALERLFGREVDLVSEKNIRNPYRRAAILADKHPLYDAA
jgi:predicted nucleotidyltransferase